MKPFCCRRTPYKKPNFVVCSIALILTSDLQGRSNASVLQRRDLVLLEKEIYLITDREYGRTSAMLVVDERRIRTDPDPIADNAPQELGVADGASDSHPVRVNGGIRGRDDDVLRPEHEAPWPALLRV